MTALWHGPLSLVLTLYSTGPVGSVAVPNVATPNLTSPAHRSGPVATQAPTSLLVHVVDSASRRPLPNAEVSSPSVRRLTDAQGNARFTWPAGGAISVRVRQIGFRYVDRTLHRGTSATATVDTVTIVLAPATFALPQVVTQADVRCDERLDSAAFALSTSTMELLRFGAEQYNAFRDAYRFDVTLARRTVRTPAFKGPRVEESVEVAESESYPPSPTRRSGRATASRPRECRRATDDA